MAQLNKHLFGKIRGRFGQAVFRHRNNINYIAQRPISYRIPDSESFQIRKNKFKIASKLASVINSEQILKSIWKTVTPDGLNPYNYLISVNYNAINNLSVGSLLKIVPDSKIGVRLDNVSYSDDKLIINLQPLTEASLIDTEKEKNCNIISIIYFSNPSIENIPDYEIILLTSNIQGINLYDSLSFEFLVSTNNQLKFSLYQNKNLFFTLLTYDDYMNIINFSSTVYSSIQ